MSPEQFATRLEAIKAGDGWKARCPAHEDDKPSLMIGKGEGGKVLLCCHAGCTPETIVNRLGLKMADLFPPQPSNGFHIAKTFDYVDEHRRLLFQVCRFEPKDFRQRKPDGAGGWSWKLNGCRRVLYRLPELIASASGEIVFIPEGEKDVDRLRGLELLAVCNSGGAGKWRTEYSESLLGRRVVILPDNDEVGREHADAVAKSLIGKAASVVVLELPGLPPKGDISDWLGIPGNDKNRLMELVQAAIASNGSEGKPEASTPEHPTGPVIRISTDEGSVNDQAVQALTADSTIFQRGFKLVHVIREPEQTDKKRTVVRPAGSPEITVLPPAIIRERLTRSARFVAFDGRGKKLVPKHPPEWCVAAIANRGQWPGIRRLEGVVNAPVLRADGSILRTPGYDPATGLIYELSIDVPEISDHPILDEVHDALELLLDVIADFPFLKESHRSMAVAAMLSLLARPAYEGPTPMFMIDANIMGVGKGKLVNVFSLIATGLRIPNMVCPESDAEFRKRITALALAGDQLVNIDNINTALGCASLDSALTSTNWRDRKLGVNDMTPTMPLRAIWFATANNVVLRNDSDIPRRLGLIRLESKQERPEERTGFRHPNLEAYVLENRGRLLAAGLTILRAYIVNGRPDMNLRPWGSFEEWTALVRNALVWAGMEDPGLARIDLRNNDTIAAALPVIFAGLESLDPAGAGMTVSEMVRRIKARALFDPGEKAIKDMHDTLVEICPCQGKDFPSVDSIGRKFRRMKGRVIGGKCLEKKESRHSEWFVQNLGDIG